MVNTYVYTFYDHVLPLRGVWMNDYVQHQVNPIDLCTLNVLSPPFCTNINCKDAIVQYFDSRHPQLGKPSNLGIWASRPVGARFSHHRSQLENRL